MIKAVIFDLDGTTLNTIEDLQNSMNIILRRYKMEETTREKMISYLGRGARNLIKDHFSKQTSEETIDKIASEFVEVYSSNYNVYTKPYDGIYELLIELQRQGIIIAVNSNKPNAFCEKLMSSHFPKIKFEIIIGQRKGIPIKPDPYSLNEIIEKLNINKNEVIYIGDSESDVMTAKNAGVQIIGCAWGFRGFEALKQAGADIVISSPKELLEYID